MMAGIKAKNTAPELLVRKALHKAGFRFRLHDRKLPGKPDLVLPKWKAVIFVHGCFWHGHDCRFFKMPKTRTEFWAEKINANRVRDERALQSLRSAGWRTLVVWECALRGLDSVVTENHLAAIADWLLSRHQRGFIDMKGIRLSFDL